MDDNLSGVLQNRYMESRLEKKSGWFSGRFVTYGPLLCLLSCVVFSSYFKRPSPRERAYTPVRLVFIAVTRVCLDHRYIILSYMLHSVKYQFREIEEVLSHSDD